MADQREWNRRSLLRSAAAMAGVAVAVPMLGGTASASAQTGGNDADALFRAGKFEQAARAYEAILKNDPTSLNAARQRGYIALLSNTFPDSEKYLSMALALAPADAQTNSLLADCYIRQDKYALSVPCWQAAGEDAYAKWFAALPGNTYQINGDLGTLPIQQMDPDPLVEVSINGGPAKRLNFYTGAPNLTVSGSVAKEAGLSAISSEQIDFEGETIWIYYGILDSIALGGLELHNVPVGWSTTESGADVSTDNDGLIGTWVFYHLLATFDYAGGSLILRPPTSNAARYQRAGTKPLPLYLAMDHYLQSIGSFAGSGPRLVGVNLGGSGDFTAGMPGAAATQLGIRTDYDRPIGTFGHSHATTTYPCYPSEIRIGDAIANDIYCEMDPNAQVNVAWPYGPGFDLIGHFDHCFWKPYTVTLDFTGMNVYIARGKAS